MAAIRVLDQHTAELIAAGEVVERPASVVKELLENAIDAGASQVTISIQRGGVQCIEVADNGNGIDTEDIPVAFIRHATSKIATQDDLENIRTLGFRGEALASIASVARVELLTCTAQDEFASLYRIEGGREQGLEPSARPVGTTITVRDLFYNTPARMKFLKKDSSEGTFVAETVQRVALSHPEVSIAFVREGKRQFRTPGDGSLSGAVYTVLGREFARDLLAADASLGPYRVEGVITPPRACRASRGMQYFYINGRFVKNRTMMAAAEAAYKGTVMQGKFPGCVLRLTMPPELVDVNVHPAKTEVRFAREQEVFDAVYKAVRLALTAPGSGEQQLTLDKEASVPATRGLAAIPAQKPQPAAAPVVQATPAQVSAVRPAVPAAAAAPAAPAVRGGAVSASPARPVQAAPSAPAPRPVMPSAPKKNFSFASSPLPYGALPREPQLDIEVEDEEELPVQAAPQQAPAPAQETAAAPCTPPEENQVPAEKQPEQPAQPQPLEPAAQQSLLEEPADEPQPLELVGELFSTYILAQRGQELCFIDKHAAHERLLYEKLCAQKGASCGQMLLAPVSVQLSAAEKNALLQNLPLLAESGVEAEDFGGNSVLVRSVPADIPPADVEDLVVELADRLVTNSRAAATEKAEWVLHSIACRAAVKAGDRSSPGELLHLARQILDGEMPPFCPHGRPVILKLTRKELEKQFGRQG